MIEILILNLRPGTRNEFHQLYTIESLPLQKKWNIDVVDQGPSLHDENSYFIFRSFTDLDERQKLQDAFYDSDDWQKGPRSAILAMIENMATAVVSNEAIKGLIK
jgi:hypothetical protein